MIFALIGAFLAGELMGILTTLMITGRIDEWMKRRERKHEQKGIQNRDEYPGGGDRGADRSEHDDR